MLGNDLQLRLCRYICIVRQLKVEQLMEFGLDTCSNNIWPLSLHDNFYTWLTFLGQDHPVLPHTQNSTAVNEYINCPIWKPHILVISKKGTWVVTPHILELPVFQYWIARPSQAAGASWLLENNDAEHRKNERNVCQAKPLMTWSKILVHAI